MPFEWKFVHKVLKFLSIFSVLRKFLSFWFICSWVLSFLLLSFSFFRLEFSLKCPNDKPDISFKTSQCGSFNRREVQSILGWSVFPSSRSGHTSNGFLFFIILVFKMDRSSKQHKSSLLKASLTMQWFKTDTSYHVTGPDHI